MRERGASRSSPPPTDRAQSVPADIAVAKGVQRAATGTPIVTSRRRPQACHRRPGLFLLVWRVKDSNLERHQPTDLQSERNARGTLTTRRVTGVSGPLRTAPPWEQALPGGV